VILMLPVREPPDLGVKLIEMVQFSCFFKLTLQLLLCAKSPETVMLDMTSAAFPPLETVTT
jgi:hypothetical protein